MSIRVMSRVWECSSQSGGALLVLLALADFANDEGFCYPSVATLARKSRLSERQVQYVLKNLVAANEIEILAGAGARQAGDGGGFTNRYRVICYQQEGCSIVTPQEKRGAVYDIEGCNLRQRGVKSTAPKPSGEPSIEPSVVYATREGQDEDAFTPDELRSEPLPPPAPKAKQRQEAQERDAKRVAIMAAYRASRFGKPLTDAVPPAEFDRMRQSADDLIAAGATAQQVLEATERALLQSSEPKFVTLRYVAGSFTELTCPPPVIATPAPKKAGRTNRPGSASSRPSYADRIAQNAAGIHAMFDEIEAALTPKEQDNELHSAPHAPPRASSAPRLRQCAHSAPPRPRLC